MASADSFIKLPDGRVLEYLLEGDVSRPVVLLSNSLLAPMSLWDPFAAKLKQERFRVLRYNQPGHGASTSPGDENGTTFCSLAADVSILLQTLGLNVVFAWIGISMGAATGVVFAASNPGVVHHLIAADTITSSPVIAGVDDPFGPWVELAKRDRSNVIKILSEKTLERWFSEEWRTSNPQEISRLRQLMNTTDVDGFITCCRALQSNTFDLKPYLLKLGAAVDEALFIAGQLDAKLPTTMDDMRKKAQKSFEAAGKANSPIELVVIEKAGHVPVIDGERQFSDVVLGYLRAWNQT
ncbi:uncharacterized protein Z518_02637 [Rhinocladiella mackenziei CBS 650.93]|uniref:Rhinocladiella mackenziei CBS 650.93 unplaced genomic scaffold supercont1.2, whole genome shotgun sequence n=1 Tax=Rhinocladiella mackenziei CBS 650.93 TaxID=1442369 RepID=A0A0D2HC19_9EURO|nr:uncharacterized protein Z518_02637 [Rhinocladiella mackenziei CBS 650.93]KIX07983.1 hypothetical protein Z518_02637 [Rhinocladiella mackenziei CBS 650.93]